MREGDQHRVGGRVEGGDEGEGCERRELACITASGVFGCTAFIILTINFADANSGESDLKMCFYFWLSQTEVRAE